MNGVTGPGGARERGWERGPGAGPGEGPGAGLGEGPGAGPGGCRAPAVARRAAVRVISGQHQFPRVPAALRHTNWPQSRNAAGETRRGAVRGAAAA